MVEPEFPDDWLDEDSGGAVAEETYEEEQAPEDFQEAEQAEAEEAPMEEQGDIEEAMPEDALDEAPNDAMETAPEEEAAGDDDIDDEELAAIEAAACARWAQTSKTNPEVEDEPFEDAEPFPQGRQPSHPSVPLSPAKGKKGFGKTFSSKGDGKASTFRQFPQSGKGKGKVHGKIGGKTWNKGSSPPWRPQEPFKGKGYSKGLKRPALESQGPPSKRPAIQTTPIATNGHSETGKATIKVKLTRPVAEKLEAVKSKGLKLAASAVQALAAAEAKDALVLLTALMNREVPNPTNWVIASLKKRAEMVNASNDEKPAVAKAAMPKPAVAKVSVAKAPPVAKAPSKLPEGVKVIKYASLDGSPPKAAVAKVPSAVKVAKTPPADRSPPVAKAAVTKAPVAKAPVAKAPVKKAPPPSPSPGKPAGAGQPPVVRTGLDFEQLAVQAKLQTLNKKGIWRGSHPLDEAALEALLRIDPGRALEILDEAEEQGSQLAAPSMFVREQVAEEEKA